MRSSGIRLRQVVVGMAVLAIALSACKASTPSASGPAASGPAAGSAGTVNLAVNPWVGYEADAAVVSYILTNQLGYTVTKKNIVEQVSWAGFSTGEVDVILENWGHEDLKATYIDQKKVAVVVGPTGRQGVIGWYVPQWMADKYPDITDWKNLNKYADLFKTTESGSLGQLLDGDPSYVTNDVALVANLKLNFKVVQGGSEATLITSLQQAQTQQKPLLAYFYSPQWALHDLKLAHINLPTYTVGCDTDPKTVACDYPPYNLDKIASKAFADANSKAYQFIKNFQWSNDDQNIVAGYIARDGMTDDAAAKKWMDATEAKWKAWLP